VLLAVDLYNRAGPERQLQAFVVHMCLAWLKLLQARWERDGKDFFIRGPGNRRVRGRDGAFLTLSIWDMVAAEFVEADPRRKNLEFFIGLRNRIEHRHDAGTALLIAGKTQALVLNYERTLVERFGESSSLAEELRFPLFLSTITSDAIDAVKRVRQTLPRELLNYIQDFDAALDPGLGSEHAYEFRIQLIPQTASKTEADVAMTFVRLEDLTPEQLEQVQSAQTIIREKQVPVEDLGNLLPSEVARRVESELGSRFSTNDNTICWKFFEARPPTGSDSPERTKADFCRYNATFRQYTYTEAWVRFLVRKLRAADTYREVLRREPLPPL
jgi:hypothetical protein